VAAEAVADASIEAVVDAIVMTVSTAVVQAVADMTTNPAEVLILTIEVGHRSAVREEDRTSAVVITRPQALTTTLQAEGI